MEALTTYSNDHPEIQILLDTVPIIDSSLQKEEKTSQEGGETINEGIDSIDSSLETQDVSTNNKKNQSGTTAPATVSAPAAEKTVEKKKRKSQEWCRCTADIQVRYF